MWRDTIAHGLQQKQALQIAGSILRWAPAGQPAESHARLPANGLNRRQRPKVRAQPGHERVDGSSLSRLERAAGEGEGVTPAGVKARLPKE